MPLTATIFPRADCTGGGEQRFCFRQKSFRRRNSTIPNAGRKPDRRSAARETAGRAGRRIRPGMRAHREIFHRRVRAVVRQRFDDAEARAAIGAVRERIKMAPVFGIKNFAQTIRAGGDVGQDQSGFAAGSFTWTDFKILVAGGVEPQRFKALNGTARRFFGI